jgi:two-component system, response regulator, stage 0 sporulation protein F
LRATGQIVTRRGQIAASTRAFFRAIWRHHLGTTLAGNDPAMKTKKILIVEDNEVVQDILRQFFEPRYTVQIASNGSQALSAIVRGSPDVALLDIKMPGLDGISLLKSLREMGVTVPIFIMTGYDSLQIAQDALNAGANGYLPKPFDLLHLDRLVADACGAEALQV